MPTFTHTQELLQEANKVLDVAGTAHSVSHHREGKLWWELASVTVTEMALQGMLSPERREHPSRLPWFCACLECVHIADPLV